MPERELLDVILDDSGLHGFINAYKILFETLQKMPQNLLESMYKNRRLIRPRREQICLQWFANNKGADHLCIRAV